MDKLRCAFRRPYFPIICKIGTELVYGDTLQQFERRLKKFDLIAEETFPLVDATGEGWVLVPKFSAISPLTLDKRWSKSRVVEMFNASANAKRAGFQYPYRSLGSRTIEVIVRDVAALLNYAEKVAPKPRAAKPAPVE
ncbi:MAG: hypothetical protein ACREP5_08065 [Candidatus Binatia bacterium]